MTPDGGRVVSASADHTLKVWDLTSGRLLTTLHHHADWVSACAVTPDGRRVVSASADQTLKIWDLESGLLLTTLQGHAAWVRACAMTPDGRHVISASADGVLKIWDLESSRLLATLQGHSDGVTACAVTPDGRRLVSVSEDQTLRVWDLELHACMLTHYGNAGYTTVATTAAAIIAGDARGSVWFLDWPPSTASLLFPTRRPVVPRTKTATVPVATPVGSPDHTDVDELAAGCFVLIVPVEPSTTTSEAHIKGVAERHGMDVHVFDDGSTLLIATLIGKMTGRAAVIDAARAALALRADIPDSAVSVFGRSTEESLADALDRGSLLLERGMMGSLVGDLVGGGEELVYIDDLIADLICSELPVVTTVDGLALLPRARG